MKTDKYDVLIIGGGASGLAAAISAKRTNKKASVAVVERLSKTGKKILATGNGRCNLSNTDINVSHYHGTCSSLLKTISGFSVPDFFASLGVLCEDDGYGRIYPRCRSAASVLDALRLECAKLGIEEICNTEITGIEVRNGFVLKSANVEFYAKNAIIAGGGKSQSALGSNGSMLDICAGLGIKITAPYPALVPLKTDHALVKPLKGQRADANVMFCADRKCVSVSRGEVQFTDGLLSGICVFDISYLYEQYKGSDCQLRIDLLPDMSTSDVEALLKTARDIRSGTAPDDFLSGIFTRALGIYVLKKALHKLPETTGKIKNNDITAISAVIKSLTFPVTGTAGFDRSQVTGGGIAADEINEAFGIRHIDGMYVCGEILDIFGDCGGYNLDFAFSSGAIAGRNAAVRAARK